jgi:hypothetical protein
MISRTMSHFDPTINALLHAVGLDASLTGTLLLSLSTIAGTEISNPSWVNFHSAGWVSFQSAPTECTINGKKIPKAELKQYLPAVYELEILNAGGHCEYLICYDKRKPGRNQLRQGHGFSVPLF